MNERGVDKLPPECFSAGIAGSTARTAPDAKHLREQLFQLLVESVVDYAIFLLDTDGYIVSWNKGAERINGYAADEIVGKHFSVFYTTEDIARDHPAEELRIALRDGRYEEEGWRVRKDGTPFVSNVIIAPMFDDAGVHCGFSKVTRDITERKRLEEYRLDRMRDQISRGVLRDILFSVTEGRLRFCETPEDLPEKFAVDGALQPFMRDHLASIRRTVRETAIAAGFRDERVNDLLTAVGEASMNAVVHARNARYQVAAIAGTTQIWIEDRGVGIDLRQLHRATLERGFTTRGTFGHGFWLMIHTCDRVWLHTTSEGTTVVLEQDAVSPVPAWVSGGRTRDRRPPGILLSAV
jgi:PAS domain S-box-containing protein